MYRCLNCGHEADDQTFIYDYIYDCDVEDEVSVLKCPKCGNDDEESIIEID